MQFLSTGSSLSLCDSTGERGIISTSSGRVLVNTSLPVDPVYIRCGYQDQLYTDPAIVTYYYNGVWVTDEGLIIQDPAVYFDDGDQICSFVSPIEMQITKFSISSFGKQYSYYTDNAL